MSSEPEGARPQDVARPHRRTRGAPAPETERQLERYRAAMRAELDDLLAEIRPATGQLETNGTVTRPKLEDRRALWDLAIKLGRELAAATELGWAGDPAPAIPAGRRAARAPALSRKDRTALGQE